MAERLNGGRCNYYMLIQQLSGSLLPGTPVNPSRTGCKRRWLHKGHVAPGYRRFDHFLNSITAWECRPFFSLGSAAQVESDICTNLLMSQPYPVVAVLVTSFQHVSRIVPAYISPLPNSQPPAAIFSSEIGLSKDCFHFEIYDVQ